jgi:hypothetical protein
MALREASTWPRPLPGLGLSNVFIGRCGRGLTPQHPTEPTIKVIEAVAGGDSNARSRTQCRVERLISPILPR